MIMFNNSLPLVSTTNLINPVHSVPFHYLKNCFNIILVSTPNSSKRPLSVPFRFLHLHPVCNSLYFNSTYILWSTSSGSIHHHECPRRCTQIYMDLKKKKILCMHAYVCVCVCVFVCVYIYIYIYIYTYVCVCVCVCVCVAMGHFLFCCVLLYAT